MPLRRAIFSLYRLLPGLVLCVAITALAMLLQRLEVRLFGRAWVEALVLAILAGTAVRTVWTPDERWQPGIGFSAKLLLEIAVVLLGATISAGMVFGAGAGILAVIAGTVIVTIAASYGIGRLFGLPHCMATLIACGNSICGNSAIAAVAPVIGADSEDVAASIAFTAVLGVAVVIGLPLLSVALHLSPKGFGILAGLTVYAVPQVLAATVPVSALSAQVGTLVKLVRVLMLGPVVLGLSLFGRADGNTQRLRLHHMVPWFIVGFLALIAARSAGWIPSGLLAPAGTVATWLTIVAMAALGLGVDLRSVVRAGLRVTSVVTLSLLVLGTLSLALIDGLHLG
ncbi:MAG: YeiH family putative sulfate export transporter [Proteobacteria bacterium]|nr:YeiH family putative sulfate export transporter [Pseudomonadota bacterium]